MPKTLRSLKNFCFYRGRRIWWWCKERFYGARQSLKFRKTGPSDLDPRIRQPAHMPLDDFIDTDRLKSLDKFLTQRVTEYLSAGSSVAFRTGRLRKDLLTGNEPGSRVINLSRPIGEATYLYLAAPQCWEPDPCASDFKPLMEFIETLPFQGTARIIIMADPLGRAVSAHRDHDIPTTCHEFVWFRTNLDKPFFLENPVTRERQYIRSHTAWFDTVNQYHGADAIGKLSFSIRVDGQFTDEFRSRMPDPGPNKASRPSLWATLAGQVAKPGRGT